MNPTEAQEAATLVAFLRTRGYKFHHSPNETGQTMEARRRAVRMKREGTSKGFPDYLVLVPGTALGIELKRRKGSNITQEQRDWIDALNAAGIPSIIAKGAEEAIKFVQKHDNRSNDVVF